MQSLLFFGMTEAGLPQRAESVVVRVPNWLGDAVMCLPALEALAGSLRPGRLVALARPGVADLFALVPEVDSVITTAPGGAVSRAGLRRLLAAGAALVPRRPRFELGIAFPESFSSALDLLTHGCAKRVGWLSDGRGPLLTHRLRKTWSPHSKHMVDEYLELVSHLGCAAARRVPRLSLTPETVERGLAKLKELGLNEGSRYIVLSPGAAYGPSKRWPPENYAQLADWIAGQRGHTIVLAGAGSEVDLVKRVASLMNHPSVVTAGATGLRDLAVVLSHSALFVGNDSGPAHMAAALGAPTAVIFGSSDPAWTAPRGDRCSVVRVEIPCAPCLRPTCEVGYKCLTEVSPELVWQHLCDESLL